MNDFFMRCNEPNTYAFSLFGAEHIFLLLLLVLALSLLLHWTKHASDRTRRLLLYTSGILVPVLELSHSVWMYLTGTTPCLDAQKMLCKSRAFFY